MSIRYRGRGEQRGGRICVGIIVLAMVGVMSVQIVNLYRKDQLCIVRQESLEEQKILEEQRQQELEEYEAYTRTQDFVEDTAKSKLGMVYKDEIIFKEKK